MADSKHVIPSLPGTYALISRAEQTAAIQVGALGEMRVEPGVYIYVGSALGSGGLRGRLQHHLKPAARPHWHIDYLRLVTEVAEIWYLVSTERLECMWARQLEGREEVSVPLKKLGASDCNCPAHLFYAREFRESWLCGVVTGYTP